MSGLVAFTGWRPEQDPAATLRRAAEGLSGPNHDVTVHVEDGFGVAVASRFPRQEGVASRGGIHRGEAWVVAMEGYVLNLPELDGRPGDGDRERRLGELFEARGDDIFPRLNGAYVLVIWDRRQRRLVTHVSKAAQRSFFRRPVGEGFVFSTEAKVFPGLTGQGFELDLDGLGVNMISGINYGTETCFKDVRRCFQGSIGRARGGHYEETMPRFVPARTEPTGESEEEIVEHIDVLLRQSITRLLTVAPSHMVMMSSGVDSTLIAALVKALTGKARTITQGWPGRDEREAAAKIAEHLGTDHSSFRCDFTGEDIVEGVEVFTRLLEEPSWGQFALPLHSFSQRTQDISATYLNGLAADVLFGEHEYETFDDSKQRHFDYIFEPWHLSTIELTLNVSRENFGDFRRVVAPNLPEARVDRYVYSQLMGHNSRLEICGGSYMAQRIGGESLSVFMDDDVILYALSIPPSMKLRGDETKPLLRKVLDRYVPRPLIPPGKRGYWAHIGREGGVLEWVDSQSRLEPVLAVLEEKRTLERDVYISGNLEKLIAKYRSGKGDRSWHTALWQLLSLELFFREFLDAPVTATV